MTATATDRLGGFTLRSLAVLAVAAVTMSLLPLAGTAFAQQEDVIDPNDACPEEPPPAPYTDRDDIPDVHVRNVDCVTEEGIALGFGDNTYRPRLAVRRDQMASFIARTIEAAGHDLPDASEHQGFDDTAGNEHEDRIRQLAAAGIVLGGPEELPETSYGPARRVRRDQMTSFLIRAAEHAFDQELGSTNQQFTDVPAGNTHFENVNAAAEFGLALGGPGGQPTTQFGPSLQTRRDQMASFLARLLQFLEQGPPVEPTVTGISLAQGPDENTVGETHTVTATVTGDGGAVEDADVRFAVTRDGAPVDLGADATATTNAGGDATLSYTSDAPGVDTIVACIDEDATAPADCAGADFTSDPLTKTWVEAEEPVVTTVTATADPETQTVSQTATVTATVLDQSGEPMEGVEVAFTATSDDGAAPVPETATVTTNVDGEAEFGFTSADEGTVTVTADADGEQASATVAFVDPPILESAAYAGADDDFGTVDGDTLLLGFDEAVTATAETATVRVTTGGGGETTITDGDGVDFTIVGTELTVTVTDEATAPDVAAITDQQVLDVANIEDADGHEAVVPEPVDITGLLVP